VLGAPEALGAGAERLRLWRRVSWTPGAEGAPRVEGVVVVVLLEGTMRRDCEGVLVGCVVGLEVMVVREGGRTIVSLVVVPGGRPVCVWFGGALLRLEVIWPSWSLCCCW
jgi:hypothetical protein